MALAWGTRNEVLGQLLEWLNATAKPNLTKEDFRAAVHAVDDWIEANQASFNAAIPQPARSALSMPQKMWLFLTVLQRRNLP